MRYLRCSMWLLALGFALVIGTASVGKYMTNGAPAFSAPTLFVWAMALGLGVGALLLVAATTAFAGVCLMAEDRRNKLRKIIECAVLLILFVPAVLCVGQWTVALGFGFVFAPYQYAPSSEVLRHPTAVLNGLELEGAQGFILFGAVAYFLVLFLMCIFAGPTSASEGSSSDEKQRHADSETPAWTTEEAHAVGSDALKIGSGAEGGGVVMRRRI